MGDWTSKTEQSVHRYAYSGISHLSAGISSGPGSVYGYIPEILEPGPEEFPKNQTAIVSHPNDGSS